MKPELTEEQKAAIAMQYYKDVALLFTEAESKANKEHQVTLTNSGGKVKKCGAFRKVMYHSHQDSQKRARIEKAFNAAVLKAGINTTDIGPLLITSLSDRISWVRNEETMLLNAMDAWARPDFVVDDWTYRISERRQGNIYATQINPETTLGSEVSPVWDEKYNTLAFWGDPVSASFVGSQMASRQRGIDVLKEASESEMLRIRRAKNRDYINGVEQKSFQPAFVPTVGGLLMRTLTNTDTGGGGTFSDALMETNLVKIDTVIGRKTQKCVFTTQTETRTARDNEVDRFGGNNVEAFYKFSSDVKAKLAEYKVIPDRYYDAATSGVVPFIYDVDMPTGTMLCLTLHPDYMPLEAKFLIGDEEGPWSWIRPVEELREVVMIMDGATMDDTAEDSRFVITDLL